MPRIHDDVDMKVLTKLPKSNIYLYSAVAVYKVNNSEAAEKAKKSGILNAVALTGFHIPSSESLLPTKCCIMLRNRNIISSVSLSKYTYHRFSIRQGFQLHCPYNGDPSDLRSISLTFEGYTCHTNENYYIAIRRPKQPVTKTDDDKTIAVCIKLAYGNLNAEFLTEWFEAYRFLGVDFVFTHTYKLNSHARNVLAHYALSGFVEANEFDLPRKDIQPEVDTNNRQGWSDEQVALFNCQAQLLLYDYVLVVDTDEFLIPTSNANQYGIRDLFKDLFNDSTLGSVAFGAVLHLMSWGYVIPSHSLVLGKYVNCTEPIFEREKLVYMPTKTELGTIFSHGNILFKGFVQKFELDRAVIHHYRSCRKDWLIPKSKLHNQSSNWIEPRSTRRMKKPDEAYFHMTNERACYDFRRRRSDDIEKLISAIEKSVKSVLEAINSPTS